MLQYNDIVELPIQLDCTLLNINPIAPIKLRAINYEIQHHAHALDNWV